MDEKEEKNETPNCGSHVKPEFPHQQMCGRGLGMPCGSTHLDEIYREKISESIKNGFETLSNSLVECALILSSEEYANSLVKEREEKKRLEEEKKRKEEEARKERKVKSEKMFESFKINLKDEIDSMDISKEEKAKAYETLISENPIDSSKLIVSKEVTTMVKKAFFKAIEEVNPELGSMLNNVNPDPTSFKLDPMMITMIMPDVMLPPVVFATLMKDDSKEKLDMNPMMMSLLIGGKVSNIDPMLTMLMAHK
jgi:hypothetical protein